MQNLLKGLPESVQQTISAGLPLVIVIILFVLLGGFGVPKVVEIRTEISSAESSQNIMTQKLKLLQTFSSTASTVTSAADTAVPSTDSTLEVIPQIRTVAIVNGIQLSSIKTSGGQANGSGLNQSVVSFIAVGTRQQIFSFIDGLTNVAPIIVIDKISISEVAGSDVADMTVDSYWADFPKTIPSIDAPISGLTQTESDTLSKISALTQPVTTSLTPQTEGFNPSPFGQ
jgi:hypothetical protein